MKVTPASTAAVSVASASASLTSPQSAPSCQAPSPTTPTPRPVRPRMRSSMPPSLLISSLACGSTAHGHRYRSLRRGHQAVVQGAGVRGGPAVAGEPAERAAVALIDRGQELFHGVCAGQVAVGGAGGGGGGGRG